MNILKALTCLLLISAAGIASHLHAQYLVKGIVKSTDDKLPLPGATIKAVSIADSTMWYGAVSDAKGSFELLIPVPGDYEVMVTYVGFEGENQNVSAGATGLKDLGTISLSASARLLEKVEVEGRLERVRIEGDTAVYNADAFKVNRDADAAKLLEKMPGVVNAQGGLNVQGERVQRVLVDGKEFFGNDPRTALNTIPAEIIDKIQVFDQMSEQSQATGFNDGNTIKTINIITKSGKNQGEFGKMFAGYGTDNRYLAGGNLNKFKGDERISILALSNNVNQVNFATEDIAGSIGSTADEINNPRRGPRRAGAGTGNANDFLVPPQAGINTTSAIGLNYSNVIGTKIKLNGSYFFNTTANRNDNLLLRTFSGGQVEGQQYREQNLQRSDNTNHRINLRGEYDIDDKNSILLRPSISFQNASQFNNQAFTTSIGDSLLRFGNNRTDEQNKAVNFRNELLYRRKLGKTGQTFSVSIQNSYNDNDGTNALRNTTSDEEVEEDVTIDWRAARTQNIQDHSANFSYTHPIGEKLSAELGYRPRWQQSTSDWNTKNRDASDDYSLLDSTLSNTFQSTFIYHEARFRLRQQLGKGGFAMVGLNYEYVENDNKQSFPEVFTSQRIYRNLLPFALFRKTFSNKASLFAIYRIGSTLPTVQQLNTVADNSNPLQVSLGNAELNQSIGHRFVVRFNQTNATKGTNFFAFMSFDAQDDRISNSTTVVRTDTLFANRLFLPAGGQITSPVNLDGFLNFRTFANYGFPVDVIKSNINLNATLTAQRVPGLVDNSLNFAETVGLNSGILIGSNISERVDFKVGANASYNWASNTLNTQQDFNYQTYSANIGGVFTPQGRWLLSTELVANVFRGLGNLDQEFLLWNASVGYRFLRDESLELRLIGFDLLAQNNSVSRTITETFVEDVQTAVLQRYLMVSLSYRLRNFKTDKPEGRSRE